MHLFFSVGEPSGDQHAAKLIAELRRSVPNAKLSGFGGPHMQAVGFQCDYHWIQYSTDSESPVISYRRKCRYAFLQRNL